MRALIMASASLETVMVPSSTCATNSLTRFLPRSRPAGSLAMRPSSTIWSNRLCSTVSSAAGWLSPAFCASLMRSLRNAEFGAQFRHLVLVGDGLAQRFFQFVVALHAAAQVRETVSQLQQFPQRFDLASDILRSEIVQALEVQVDLQAARVGIFAQFVVHGKRQVRFHTFQHRIEVVRVDFDEFAIFQTGKRVHGLAGEITQNAHDERQFLDFDGVADFHVVSNLDAWRANAVDFVLRTLSCHAWLTSAG